MAGRRPGSARPDRRTQSNAPLTNVASGTVRVIEDPASQDVTVTPVEPVVEAIFYGDGTWNKAVLGAQLGQDRQQVKFVGYEGDGWQETASKDIRYPVQIRGRAEDGGGGAASSGPSTPAKAQTKKKPKDKGGRSSKKWEVVSGFLDQTTRTGDRAAIAAAANMANASKRSGGAGGSDAPPPTSAAGTPLAVHTGDQRPVVLPTTAPPATASTPAKQQGGGQSNSASGCTGPSSDAEAQVLSSQEARSAVAAAAAALAMPKEVGDTEAGGACGGGLGVSYDLLTSLAERLDDLALFEPSQVDEEGLTAVLTTPEGAIRYLEMCRRILHRICTIEASEEPCTSTRVDIEAVLSGRGWIRGGSSVLLTPGGRFAALEFLVAELQACQMLADAGNLVPGHAQTLPAAEAGPGKGTNEKLTPKEQVRQAAVVKAQAQKSGHEDASKEDARSAGLTGSQVRVMERLRAISAIACGQEEDGGPGGHEGDAVRTGTQVLEAAVDYARVTLRGLPEGHLGVSVLGVGALAEEHVQVIAELSQELRVEYTLRKQMLLQRIGVVAASFAHAAAPRDGAAEMLGTTAQRELAALDMEPSFSVYDLLCAKSDVGGQLQLGSAAARAGNNSLKQVMIGRVPDRGGRVEEISGRDMALEVRRANESMRGKDAPRGGRGGARGGGADGGGRGGGGRGSVYFPGTAGRSGNPVAGAECAGQSVDFKARGRGGRGARGGGRARGR